MRWKKNNPNKNDTKICKKFAYFPVKLKDGYTVWLETYYIRYKYTVWYDTSLPDGWECIDSWSNINHNAKLESFLFDDNKPI
jgi:hypothetical protein